MKKYLAVLVSLSMVMLAGCFSMPSIEPQDQDLEGADWRTTGIVCEYGSLTIDGQEIDVCGVNKKNKINLYYDQESQELFKSVDFPRDLTDDEYDGITVEFDDVAGDENTDVVLKVEDQQGLILSWTWVYDTDEFVYLASAAYPPVEVDYDDEDGDNDEYDAENQGGEDGDQGHVDYSGTYSVGRCYIVIDYVEGVTYNVSVSWGSSASESAEWTMTAIYSESEGILQYSDATYAQVVYGDDGSYSEDVIYTDGSGEFELDGTTLIWRSFNSDLDNIVEETLEKID